jgi:hypothetical protein
MAMSIVEIGDDGALHVPADLLAGARPHAKFVLDVKGELIVLRPAESIEPIWENPDPTQRAEEFRRYAELPRPSAPDIPLEYLDREHLYD